MKTQAKISAILIIASNAFYFKAFSQDTISMANGNELIAKVLEISSDEIKFKKFDNPEGPTYIENKSNVIRIKYKNGLKEEFKFEKPWLKPSENAVQAVPEIKRYPRLSRSGNIYFYGDRRQSEGEMQRQMLSLNNIDLNDHIHKARLARGLQNIGFAAIPLAVIGSIYYFSAIGFYESSTANNRNFNNGTSLFGLAAISLGTSIYFKVQRNKHNAAAVKIYNETY